MKKSVAAYWVFAVSFALVFNVLIAEAKAQLLDRSLSFRDLALQLQTPEAVAHYMWRHFDFESDQTQFGEEERWQSPEEFLETRKGDCEDFALFAQNILKMNGIPSYLVNIYSHRFSHTVCVFKEHDKFNVIDGTRVIRYEAESLDELMLKIDPFWNQGALVAPSQETHQGKILAQFDRLAKAHHRLTTSA